MASPSSPVVSVVIPTYRRAGSIAVAVNSALAQTMADLEVIVVDDCSGDGTPEVIRAMADPRVRLIEHDRNRGGNAARRTGIPARGDYLAFLDSDDAWYPPKLELQLARLRELGSGYGLCYTWYDVKLADGRVLPPREPSQEGLRHPDLLVHNFIGTFSTFLAERRWVEAVGGPDAGMPACQDWEFYLRLNAVAGVCVVEQPLVLYLLGDDHHRISTRVGAVVAGHRAVYARVRDGLGDLDAGQAVASRRNFMEVFANRGATGDVLRLARDIPLTSYTPELATFTARMAARSVRKRSAQRRASAPAST